MNLHSGQLLDEDAHVIDSNCCVITSLFAKELQVEVSLNYLLELFSIIATKFQLDVP